MERLRPLWARWREVVIVAGVLFVLNVVGRLVGKLINKGDLEGKENRQVIAGFVALGLIFLIFLVLTVRWGRSRPAGRVVTDLVVAALLGCALSIFVGPLIVGVSPFADGAGQFFAQVWWYAAIAGFAIGLGYIGLALTGNDLRSKQLKQYVEKKKAAPKRV